MLKQQVAMPVLRRRPEVRSAKQIERIDDRASSYAGRGRAARFFAVKVRARKDRVTALFVC